VIASVKKDRNTDMHFLIFFCAASCVGRECHRSIDVSINKI